MQVKAQEARPFLKWAGGKRWLVDSLRQKLAPVKGAYFEPFLGAGAVFLSRGGQHPRVASDSNGELVNAWLQIKEDVQGLIDELRKFSNSKEEFLKIRAWDRSSEWPHNFSNSERAARLIFLNKTCFNGLFRVNSRGQFNVPYGNYVNPKILDQHNLEAVSANLNLGSVAITETDFQTTAELASAGDMIYFDPPYAPISPSSSFVAYHQAGFSWDDQLRLCNVAVDAVERGVAVIISNSNNPDVRKLYERHRCFEVTLVAANRSISASTSGRAPVSELLILGGLR